MVKCTAITCTQGDKIFVGSYDHYVYCLSIEVNSLISSTISLEAIINIINIVYTHIYIRMVLKYGKLKRAKVESVLPVVCIEN